MSEGPSAPQITAQMVIVTISSKRCSLVRSIRGSSSASKCSMMVDVGISNTVSIAPFLNRHVPFHHFTSRTTETRCDGPSQVSHRNTLVVAFQCTNQSWYHDGNEFPNALTTVVFDS